METLVILINIISAIIYAIIWKKRIYKSSDPEYYMVTSLILLYTGLAMFLILGMVIIPVGGGLLLVKYLLIDLPIKYIKR